MLYSGSEPRHNKMNQSSQRDETHKYIWTKWVALNGIALFGHIREIHESFWDKRGMKGDEFRRRQPGSCFTSSWGLVVAEG